MDEMEIIRVEGTEPLLYQLVAPLVMSPKVLRQNYNFPFRTSEKFVWYIALAGEKVAGFIPLERRASEHIINNYYIEGKQEEVLEALLAKVLEDEDGSAVLSAVAFLQDRGLFARMGFLEEKQWTRYVRMHKEPEREKGRECV